MTPSWLDGEKRPLASRDAAGRRARAAPIRPRPIRVARGAPNGRARAEQEHEQQRAEAEDEDVDVDPGVGLGASARWPIGIDDASRRSRAPTASPAPATMAGSDGQDHARSCTRARLRPMARSAGRSSAVSAIRRCRAWAPATSAASPATAAKAHSPTARTLVPSATLAVWSRRAR